MFGQDSLTLGIVFLVLGAGLALLTLLAVRAARRLPVSPADDEPLPIPLGLENHEDAVLGVLPGGRVAYSNATARLWFGAQDETPSLERLARRARPSEAFLSLCAAEGQTRLSIDGRIVEGSSYRAQLNGNGSLLMVVLRRPQVAVDASGEVISGQTLEIFSELSQAMAASLDLESTLQAVLTSAERLVPADLSEITLWDADKQWLIPFRLAGLPGVDRRIEKSGDPYQVNQGYSGYLARERQPLLIADVDAPNPLRPALDRSRYPFRSYLGVPLLTAGELVGTLELAAFSKDHFSENDLEALRILSGQAALALHNALLFEQEQQESRELAGLARLAQAISSIRDPHDLYTRLVESLAPLIDVEMLGFVLYDEAHGILKAEAPFAGMPAEFLDFYQVTISSKSPAEALIRSQQIISAPAAAQDAQLKDLGIAHVAQAAGMQTTLLAPLNSGGRNLGFLQVANRRDGLPFDDNDVRLISIIAGQVGPLLENANLIQEARRRARRSEALRRIASLAGSAATLDEILQYSLQELASILEAEIAAIYLLDDQVGELRAQRSSLIGLDFQDYQGWSRLPVDDPQFRQTVTCSQRNYLTGQASADERILMFFRGAVEALEIESLIDVPLVVRERGIGEIILASRKPAFFDETDLVIASTAAGQLAGAVERALLYTQTDDSLRRRVEELTAVTRISRELNATQDLQRLFGRVYEEALRATSASGGRIVLLDPYQRKREHVALQVGSLSTPDLLPQERQVIRSDEHLLLADFAGSELANPDPAANSALLTPISYQDAAVGLIHLWSTAPAHFDQFSLEITQALAVQAAIALGNTLRHQDQARRNELLNRRVETLGRLLQAAHALQLDQPLEQSLKAIAEAIQEATPFQAVLISVYDHGSQNLLRTAGIGFSSEEFRELKTRQHPWRSVQEYLRSEYRQGGSYFIPAERKPVDPPDVHVMYPESLVGILPGAGDPALERTIWHPDDLLLAPVMNPAGKPLGLISVDAPRNGLRPDWPTLETLEIFASQAALAIQSQRVTAELKAELSQVNHELERLERSAEIAQSNLPVLLRKDLQQTIAIQQLSRRARRIRAGLEIAELLNRQPERSALLHTLAYEMLMRFDMDLALTAELAAGEPRLVEVLIPQTSEANLQAFLGQRNPLNHSLQSGEMLLAPNVLEDNDWRDSTLLQVLEVKAFLCLPVVVEGGERIAVLVGALNPLTFTADDRQTLALLGRQAGLALQNLALIGETSQRLEEVNLLLDFSRQLGSLESQSILTTLLDSALKVARKADSGLVLTYDEAQRRLVPAAARGYVQTDKALALYYQPGEALPGKAFASLDPVNMPEVNFAHHYNLAPEKLLLYRDATGGRLPVSSLLLPIRSGERALGVLLIDSFREVAAFSQKDQNLLASLTQQTALALENARLYQAAESRASQLQAMTEIAGKLSASLDSETLLQALLPQLGQVIAYDTATLWLRTEEQLTVRAARGFDDNQERIGVSANVEDSRLFAEMIATGQPVTVADVRQDGRFPALVEAENLSWLGVPIIAKGEVVGVIALEKREADFYSPDVIQVALTFANQAAVALENANLFEDSLRRALELDERTNRLAQLNRLSTTLGSSLELERLLGVVQRELASAVRSTSISLILFDRHGRPAVWRESLRLAEGAAPLEYPRLLPQAGLFDHLHQTSGVFSTFEAAQEDLLAPLAEHLARHNTRALLAIPIATGEELLGVALMHESRTGFVFSAEEAELGRTICNQSAISLQNARYYQETRQRLNELSVINRISQQISATIDLDELFSSLPVLLAEIIDTSNIYLALYDRFANRASFPVAFEQGQAVQIPPGLPGGLTGNILQTGKALLLAGTGVSAKLAELGALQYGALTAAAYLGVPLVAGEQVIGVLAVQSPDQPDAYTEDDERLLSTVASQISVAIENSRLYGETRQRSAELKMLYDYGVSISNVLDETRLVELTFSHLRQALGAESGALVLRQPDGSLTSESFAGETHQPRQPLPVDEAGFSEQVLVTQEPLLLNDLSAPLDTAESTEPRRGTVAWLGAPLVVRGAPVGVLSLHSSQPNAFDESDLQLISQVAAQLATALDNAQLFAQTQMDAANLAQRVAERTEQLSQEHARTQTLLRIITELSASLDMDIVLNRTLGLINQIMGAEQSSVVLVDSGENTLSRRASLSQNKTASEIGDYPLGKTEETLANWVISHRQPLLLEDLWGDTRWSEPRAERTTIFRSALITPLMVGEESLGALMLFHRQAERFSSNQLDLVQATAKQIAVAINNAKLYRLIRDQAERLGDYLRTQHVETSRSQAILEAVADGVLVTDANSRITLFNASAERILKLDKTNVLAKPLDTIMGVFGKAARQWSETIRTWSKNPAAYQSGDVFDERLDLDDGRVVSVQLAPVRLRNEFLGTVSIFRDITVEVEVDRLKSEFVANVSHELRTPMTSIKGYVDILLMGAAGEISDTQKNFLGVVKSNTERLIVLVNDLLEVSRLEAGKVLLQPEPLDLRQIAGDVIEGLRKRSQDDNRPMEIVAAFPQKLPRVLGDSERVRQIIDNLIDNAYHYTPPDGRIEVRMSASGGLVRVDVQDTGIGISPTDQTAVFERFYRGEHALVLETPGTGLGLAVVKTLVEMHGGHIWVESSGIPGEGSTFSFTLPAIN